VKEFGFETNFTQKFLEKKKHIEAEKLKKSISCKISYNFYLFIFFLQCKWSHLILSVFNYVPTFQLIILYNALIVYILYMFDIYIQKASNL